MVEQEGVLVLANGAVFKGRLIGNQQSIVSGEVIFNTSLTGYQEILTDPSYHGQIVVMTNPHIGNYGITPEDAESPYPRASALVVRELSAMHSNWRAAESLEDYLMQHQTVALDQVDTRAIVRKIRMSGTLPGFVSSLENTSIEKLQAKAKVLPIMTGSNLVSAVSTKQQMQWQHGKATPIPTSPKHKSAASKSGSYKVLAYDYGIKSSILNRLEMLGCQVEVAPYHFSAAHAMQEGFDGVFLSNGPGDPEPVTQAIAEVRQLLRKLPIFGICLGHQILGIAVGGKSYKLHFGHHGANHPVMDLKTGKVEITSQNHGFSIDEDSLPEGVEVTHRSLNDKTVEGIATHLAYSVQYHPEASPGPHDSHYLFQQFIDMMAARRNQTVQAD